MAPGALATWAGSEGVLPAYLTAWRSRAASGATMRSFAGSGSDHRPADALLFHSSRIFCLHPAVLAAPLGVAAFLAIEMATKIVGVYPMARRFGSPRKDAMHTALLMASGLTFGTILALFGLSNKITDESQYSTLVAAIIATAIVSAMIANGLYLPRHRLLREAAPQRVGSADPAKESVLEG